MTQRTGDEMKIVILVQQLLGLFGVGLEMELETEVELVLEMRRLFERANLVELVSTPRTSVRK